MIFKVWDEKYSRVPDAIVVEGPLADGDVVIDGGLGLAALVAGHAEERVVRVVRIVLDLHAAGERHLRDVATRRLSRTPIVRHMALFAREAVAAEVDVARAVVQAAVTGIAVGAVIALLRTGPDSQQRRDPPAGESLIAKY